MTESCSAKELFFECNIKCYVTVKMALQGSNVTKSKSKVSLSIKRDLTMKAH